MQHEITLFFDNDDKHLESKRELCPNVIPIKVPASRPDTIKLTNFINYYNTLDEGSRRAYMCLKCAIISKYSVKYEDLIEHFDVGSGLNSMLMNNTINALNNKSFNSKYKISACIFNINQTILKNDGFMKFPDQLSIKNIRRVIQEIGSRPLNKTMEPIDYKREIESIDDVIHIISNTNFRSEMSKITDKDIANAFLGGNNRATELTSFFKKLKSNIVKIMFLTDDGSYCPEVKCDTYSGKQVEYIKNPNYNQLFFDILVASGIIDNNFNYFMEEMMIYNNPNFGSSYNRIYDTLITNFYSFGQTKYSKVSKHVISETCLNTLKNVLTEATSEIQEAIMNENTKPKPFFNRLFGKGKRRATKKRITKTKKRTNKTKKRTTKSH